MAATAEEAPDSPLQPGGEAGASSTSCTHADGQPYVQPGWAIPPPLVPPLRFAHVEEAVYRSAYPTLVNFRFLRRLRLRTIVSMLPNEASSDLMEFCKGEGIQHKFVPTEHPQTVSLREGAVWDVLQILMVQDSLPALLHCVDGCQTTGTVVLIIRALQGWQPAAAHSDFARFSRNRSEMRVHAPPLEVVQFVDAATPSRGDMQAFCTEHAAKLSLWIRQVMAVDGDGQGDGGPYGGNGDRLGWQREDGRGSRPATRDGDGGHPISLSLDALALAGLVVGDA